MSYTPLRSWTFEDVTVTESHTPNAVLITIGLGSSSQSTAQLTRDQFEAICALGSGYRAGCDYVRYASEDNT